MKNICPHCCGKGREKVCKCHHVVNGRDARCQRFEEHTCIVCGGSGKTPTWDDQLTVRPDIDNEFAVYK